jgi:hypothetical protein
VVQEFQISMVNFDLSTGFTGAGAINIVTRSGGNDYHGSGYFFFRDHNLSAYPALTREPLSPDPFFARRQAGFYLGGPIKKERLFFFTNLENNNQRAVITVQPKTPEFAKFGGVFPSPYDGRRISVRFDVRLNANTNAFLRFTHDGNQIFAPVSFSFPSNWRRNSNWSDQSIGGLTTALRPTLINDFRFAYSYLRNRGTAASAADCPGACLGLGLPQIDLLGVDFTIGNQSGAPVRGDQRRYDWLESLTWQQGLHRMKFGFEWEHYNSLPAQAQFEPASMVLYSPERTRRAGLPLPPSFETVDDILRLPLLSFQTGIGDPGPPLFNRDKISRDDALRYYWQDTWRLRPHLTLNYGIAYAHHTQGLNLDLPKPAYLIPILGTIGLAPSRHDRNKWAPAVGFAWGVTKDNATVIRGGAGIYHDTLFWNDRILERAALAPLGGGRFRLDGSAIANPLPDVPGVSVGQALSFPNGPTAFRGADLLSILPALRAGLRQQFVNPFNTDLSVRNIEFFKSGINLLAPDFTTPYAEHFNIGVQREITRDLVLSADFVFRQYIHVNLGPVDYNHWNSVRGPVIPRCSPAQQKDVKAQCSAGEITFHTSAGRSHYKGLLVRVDKRFSKRTQFLASYALSSNVGLENVHNKDDWFDSYGPLSSDQRHILNISGVVDLPRGFQISFISSVASKAPFTAFVSGIDFNGDGTNGDVLPGTKWNQFNRGLGKSDLIRLVDEFNRTHAGTKTSRGQLIPPITLPSNFEFGDGFSSQDLRLSKFLKFRERYTLTVLGEVFNLFNIANLSGYSGNLAQTSNFGQPTNRVSQVFGSGGPRAFQVAARFSF